MALNLKVIGQKAEPVPFKYNQDSVILYALGIGAGADELDFVYEKNLKVFPTYATVPVFGALDATLADLNLNWPTVLHGEHKITLYNEIPPVGTLYSTGVVEAIYDKGDTGAAIHIKVETRDPDNYLMFKNTLVLLDRSGGNFGGDRGPEAEKFVPPEGKASDFQLAYQTSPDQALLYRLSGDKNPLHADPELAQKWGLDRPILHGLCTYGFAGRAILHSVCQSHPHSLKSFSARFMNVVFPGETLTTEGWQVENGKHIIQVKGQDGRLVLGNAIAHVAA